MAEYSEEYKNKLLLSLAELNFPKAESPSDIEKWMIKYVQDKYPKESHDKSSTSIHVNNRPRLPQFHGDLAPSKDHVSYDVWKYTLECILKEKHPESDISDAIRQSLRGEAAKVAMRLGPKASNDELIKKFDSIYATIEEKETTLFHFYSARQGENESVAAWSCRLEDILNKAIQKGEIKHTQSNYVKKYVVDWS